jgi:hypothetical protein
MNRVGLQSTHMLPKLFRPQPRAGAVTFLDGYSITRKFNGVAGSTPKIPAWQLGHVAALRCGLHGSVLCRPARGGTVLRKRGRDRAMPLSGYLDIATEDGTLRVTMTVGAAADLLIDLKNFLGLGTLGRRATTATGAAEQQNTSKTR